MNTAYFGEVASTDFEPHIEFRPNPLYEARVRKCRAELMLGTHPRTLIEEHGHCVVEEAQHQILSNRKARRL